MALIYQTIPFFNEFFQYWTKSLLACVCALLLSLTSIATAAYTQFSTENWRRTEYHAGLQLSLSWELRLPCSAFAWLSPPFLSYFQFLLQGRRTVPLGRLLTINAILEELEQLSLIRFAELSKYVSTDVRGLLRLKCTMLPWTWTGPCRHHNVSFYDFQLRFLQNSLFWQISQWWFFKGLLQLKYTMLPWAWMGHCALVSSSSL